MPLTMLNVGTEALVKGYNVKDATKKFLEQLGIIPGSSISVISELEGNLIVSVKGARVAISKGIAQRLMVEGV